MLVKVLTPGYYARGDTKTPVRFAMLSILVNIVGNLALIPTIGHVGPPLATALASTVNVAMLYRTLSKRGHFVGGCTSAASRAAAGAGGAADGGDGICLQTADRFRISAGPLVIRYAALGVLVGAGMAIYVVACFLTRAYRIADIKALLRRRASTPKPIQE